MTAPAKGESRQRLAKRALLGAVCVLVVVHVVGLLSLEYFVETGYTTASLRMANMYFKLVLRWEPWHMAIFGAVLLCGCAAVYGRVGVGRWVQAAVATSVRRPNRVVWAIAVATTLTCAVGTRTVYHGYPLSMDEYGVEFQSRIFAAGQRRAVIPEEWRDAAPFMVPLFVQYDGTGHTWWSGYLPGYSLLAAPFTRWGVLDWLNPLFAGASVLLMASVARRLWPEQRSAGVLAALLLATGPQFLITSISYYSMPAHLFFNLLWLWMLLRGGRLCLLLLPWVGLFALTLHQYVPHALFVGPFFLMFLAQRRFALLGYVALVYGVAFALYMAFLGGGSTLVGTLERLFSAPGAHQFVLQGTNLWLLFSWQSVAVAVFVLIGIARVKHIGEVCQAMVAGVVLTLAFYLFFRSDQGHGWGYRYAYAVQGNLVLLAVAGWYSMRGWLAPRVRRGLIFCSVVGALALQVPYRCVEVERTVVRWVGLWEWIETRPEAVVILDDPTEVWYGWDLVRNDPLLRDRPVVIDGRRLGMLPEDERARVLEGLGRLGSVRVVGGDELGEGMGD